MATIPRVRSQIGAPGVSGAGRSATAADFYQGSSGAGQILGQASNVLADAAQTASRRQDQLDVANVGAQLADTQVQFTQRLGDMAREADPNKRDLVTNFLGEYDSYVEQLGDGVEGATAKAHFTDAASRLRVHLAETAFSAQEKIAGDDAKVRYQTMEDQLANAVTTDPRGFDTALANGRAALDARMASGSLSKVGGEGLNRQLENRLSLSAIQGVLDKDPGLAHEQLDKGMWDSYLTHDTKIHLMDQASKGVEQQTKERLAQAEQSQKFADQREKLRGDEAFKDLAELDSKGDLSVAEVSSRRRTLTPAAYDAFLKRATDPEPPPATDRNTYAALRLMVSQDGFPTEKKVDLLQNSFVQGRLSTGDYSSLFGIAEARDQTVKAPSWDKRGREFLIRNLGGDDAEVDNMQRQAEALDDFSRWTEANPQATSDQAETYYKSLARTYTIAKTSSIYIASPRFAPSIKAEMARGDTKSVMQMLQQAATRLEAERAIGKVTDYEYRQEYKKIARWIDEMEAMDSQGASQ